jgi:outer membrane protein assembly factor BamB
MRAEHIASRQSSSSRTAAWAHSTLATLIRHCSSLASRFRPRAVGRVLGISVWMGVAALSAAGAQADVAWSTLTGGAVGSSPAIANGIVYVGSDDGALYALDASTGQMVWKTITSGPVTSSATVLDGVVHVGNGCLAGGTGCISALDAATGQVQ